MNFFITNFCGEKKELSVCLVAAGNVSPLPRDAKGNKIHQIPRFREGHILFFGSLSLSLWEQSRQTNGTVPWNFPYQARHWEALREATRLGFTWSIHCGGIFWPDSIHSRDSRNDTKSIISNRENIWVHAQSAGWGRSWAPIWMGRGWYYW